MSKAIGKKKSLAKPVKLKTKAEKTEKKAAKSQPSKKSVEQKKASEKKQIHTKAQGKSNSGKSIVSVQMKKTVQLKNETSKKNDLKANSKDVKKDLKKNSSNPLKSMTKDQNFKSNAVSIKEKESTKSNSKANASIAVTSPSMKKTVNQPSAKKPKTKKDESEMDADFLVSDDDLGTSEIAEYEEELKAVEEDDDEIESEIVWAEEVKESKDTEVFLTDAEGRRLCRARDCDQAAAVDQYCRFHYLLLWKKIQNRRKILADGKLEKYVDDLTSRYPDKYLEMIRKDLRTEKDFMGAIQELELDESANNEMEFEEDSQSFAEEIRGMGESTGVEDDEY